MESSLALPTAVAISTAPLVYLKLLRAFYLRFHKLSPLFAEAFPNLLKFIGASVFATGHALQCIHKGKAEYTDWGYILACTPCLNIAFGGALVGRPCPSALLASGLLLHVSYDPLLLRAWRSGTEKLLPAIGVSAAVLLTWLGSVATFLEHRLLSESPFLPVPVYAMMTTCSFGLGNGLKLYRLFLSQEPLHKAFVGQILKVMASSMLFTGNALGLGAHEVHVRRYAWPCSLMVALALRALAAKLARKAAKVEKCQ